MRIEYKKSGVENVLSLLQGVDVGAQRYAQGKRYNDEQAQQQQQNDRSYSLRLSEDTRRNAEEARQQQAFPLEQKAREQSVRSHTLANDQQDQYAQDQQQQHDFAQQVEIDSHRQEQAQEYKRLTGKDVPPEYWGTDSQGHKPGEMGWHWTMYDPKSEVPIKVQLRLNQQLSEAKTLPPGATQAQKVRAAIDDAKASTVRDSKNRVVDEASQFLILDAPQGGGGQEPDPLKFVPQKTLDKLKKDAEDPNVSADEMSKRWKAVQDAHSEEMAHLESRTIAVNGLDAYAQKMAQMHQDYGGDLGDISSEDFERFRKARYDIAKSKLHGQPLDDAVRDAKELLKPGPKPHQQNNMTGFNAGDALKQASAELATNPQYVMADAATKNHMLQQRASDYMRMAQALAGGSMPGQPSGNGNHPNTPQDQARAAQAVNGQGSRSEREADIRAHPEKYRGKFQSKAELEAFLNGG